ncbi:MAG: DUF2390 domain-containing protein [Gammaproteobacteria bacterium]|nr:DUF2390 domain-containing protein [Gammaproteobacteria bacterium]
MKSIADLPEHPFCTYVNQNLSHEPIKDALTSLQQHLDLNINVLLFCCWVGKSGRKQLNKKELLTILTTITPWHEQIVATLKKLRVTLQHKISSSLSHNISQLVQEQEAAANKIEQLMLTEIITHKPVSRGEKQKLNDSCRNIHTYCKELPKKPDKQQISTLKLLLSHLFPQAELTQLDSFWEISIAKIKKSANPQYSQLELDEFI